MQLRARQEAYFPAGFFYGRTTGVQQPGDRPPGQG